MIKIEKTEIVGLEPAIRGMRNPMNSWEQSDSYLAVDCGKCGVIEREGSCKPKDHDCTPFQCYAVGPSDLNLMKNLAKAGPDHGKFLRMIVVYVDITAPLYWWKEFDTYRVGVAQNPTDIEMNSCSTMHKIHAKEFTLNDFSYEHLVKRSKQKLLEKIEELNFWRNIYLYGGYESCEGKNYEPKDKEAWWQMIQLLPSSYNQKRTVMLNYAVLKNAYHARKCHKLDEWRDLCRWIESLPYSEIITCNTSKETTA